MIQLPNIVEREPGLPSRLNMFHLHDDRNVIERDVFSRLERERERERAVRLRFTPDGTSQLAI